MTAACLGDVAGCTVFYVASHGNFENMQIVKFWDGTTGPTGPPPGTPVFALAHGSDAAVKPVRETAVGQSLPPAQLPPFNPTGNPPIAFAFVDSCLTALLPTSDEFLQAFCYTLQNKYVPGQVENQAEMGWSESVPNEEVKVFTTAFWAQVELGVPVEKAKQNALEIANDWHEDKHNGSPWVYTPRVFGDLFTRLKHVYTGANSLPPVLPGASPWFRVVSTGTEGW